MIKFGPEFEKFKKGSEKKRASATFINISVGSEFKKLLDLLKNSGKLAQSAKKERSHQSIKEAMEALSEQSRMLDSFKKNHKGTLGENVEKLIDQTQKEIARKIGELVKLLKVKKKVHEILIELIQKTDGLYLEALSTRSKQKISTALREIEKEKQELRDVLRTHENNLNEEVDGFIKQRLGICDKYIAILKKI